MGSGRTGDEPERNLPGAGASPAPKAARERRPRRVRLPGARVAVERRGSGPPLLCLHGLTANRRVWYPVLPYLRDRWTVWLPDLPGRGDSDVAPGAGHRLADEVRRLEALVRRLELEEPVVAGHSHGAALALCLAGRSADPRGLVLTNPVTPWTPRPSVLRLLEAPVVPALAAPLLTALRTPLTRAVLKRHAFGDPDRVSREVVGRYAAPYADPRRVRSVLRALADWNPAAVEAYFPTSSPPARVLAGRRDRRIPVGQARRLASRIGAPLRVIEGAGHVLPEEAPAAVADAVDGVGEYPGSRP